MWKPRRGRSGQMRKVLREKPSIILKRLVRAEEER
jgi:hypothetical protein